MKRHFILGLLLVLFLVSKSNAQRQTTYLSSRDASKLMSKEMKSSLTINEYYNLAYYKLRQNNPQIAEILFKKGQKISFTRNRKYKFFSSQSLQRKKDALNKERDSLLLFDYVSSNDKDVRKEVDLHKSLIEKVYIDLAKLTDEAKSKNSVLLRYHASWNSKRKILTQFVRDNKELINPKTEFETQQQFEARINKYLSLEKEATKKIDARLARISVSYKQALRDCASVYNETESVKNTVDFIQKYPPTLKGYSTSRIQQMNYDAEKQQFTISVEYDDLTKRRKGIKSYTISVPQSAAQRFKEEKYLHKYLFQLQDLRLVVTSRKVYKIEPISTWYTRSICETDEEAPLVNGKTNGEEILKTLIENDEKVQRIIFKFLDKYYLKKYTATFRISFDSAGKIEKAVEYRSKSGNTSQYVDIDPTFPNYILTESFHVDLDWRIMDLVEKVTVTPRKESCEPKSTSFSFKVNFKRE